MCKMIHMCFSSSEGKPKSAGFVWQRREGKRQFGKDGFNKVAVPGAGVLRAGSARCGLLGCRPARSPAGPPARQAEEAPGVPSWSISHPCDREHYVAGHRAARLPQEAERSSRTGNDTADSALFMSAGIFSRGLCMGFSKRSHVFVTRARVHARPFMHALTHIQTHTYIGKSS